MTRFPHIPVLNVFSVIYKIHQILFFGWFLRFIEPLKMVENDLCYVFRNKKKTVIYLMLVFLSDKNEINADTKEQNIFAACLQR